MKEIKLTQGYVTQVDDEDYDFLMQWKWFIHRSHGNIYAVRKSKEFHNYERNIRIHRIIMKTPIDLEVDHIDHNGLNNQKSNLRNCTHQQNIMNKKPHGTSRYLGVSRHKSSGYQVGIVINGKRFHIGVSRNEIDAAKIYDKAAIKYFGEFANLNFK